MTEHFFSLVPFPELDIPDIAISGSIARDHHVLTVHYSLVGDVERISIPAAVPQPSRQSELWTSTCFEFFLAIPDRPEYWEFNLSPSGNWNVFQMDAYRRAGFREEARIDRLQITSRHSREQYALEGVVDLHPILAWDEPIRAGVTSVIQTIQGGETYWALVHPGPEADFHLRESFILPL
ncbi:MAG TPA: DOMON-like domain-containing protein [Anaerolineales bacterium]|nr:DOMON-like domain-containing protein [Anaerolineales bacterium]